METFIDIVAILMVVAGFTGLIYDFVKERW